jgi:hypothetical protein
LRRGGKGDFLIAEIMNGYINAYISTGQEAGVRGLLGNRNRRSDDDLSLASGAALTQPVAFTDLYGSYAESWRVPPDRSLLCGKSAVAVGAPTSSIFADDLDRAQYVHAQKVCAAGGVRNEAQLNACILDVTVLGDQSARNVFVAAPTPVAVMEPLRPPR